jgi:NAD(P)-dependent dehydrogenase (short-subunit alcohol dehydrogenase family)/rhamnose utilization protein RhaD (predicted bifunctional aldolase and dehydrogenase)
MDLSELITISRRYGTGSDFAIAGGGNTSVKDAKLMAIKASGTALRGITEEGFVELTRPAVRAILARRYSEDPFAREAEIKADLMASRTAPEKGGRPSVEASLHESIEYRYVVHTHPCEVNALLCARDGAAMAARLFGAEALFLPYTDPGYRLAKSLEAALTAYRAAHHRDPKIVLMENHGLVVASDTVREIEVLTDELVARIRKHFRSPLPAEGGGAEVPEAAVSLLPALRALLAGDLRLSVAAARSNPLVSHFLKPENRGKVSLPFTPDDIVYCKSAPLFADFSGDAEAFLAGFPRLVDQYRAAWGFLPKILLVGGLGIVAVEQSKRSAETCLDVFQNLMKVAFLSEGFGGPKHLGPKDIAFIDTWEVENYRRSVAAKSGARRLEGRVAVVTGAAQGFGRGIAEGLFREGANVVIADLNEAAGRALEAELGGGEGAAPANRAVFQVTDVTNPASLKALARRCAVEFGGIDILVSNAGVLRAGSLEEMTEESFDFVTRVNYTGYFLCVKHLSPIMKVQHRYRPAVQADIIQINSKSGLEGSNKNFAYAGGKFGGIGLTESFALELVEHGVKVNSICPGNFFEGPLWSDPKNGLFVQYLNAGKVPGAKSIDDVRRFYESKVPMGRGCRVEDVMRAILYVVEQEYETGQAVPVTGGQVMLR